jgi:hypothetical protein
MEFEFDLAISLLEEDAQLGWDIVNALGSPDSIFFYEKDVDKLLFKNGVNLFADVFSKQSRFVLVLYCERYGTTDWTAVEYSVIQERFKKTIKNQNSPILFCKLDDSATPSWLPETYIYGSIGKMDDFIKIIRKRINDLGGSSFPQTTEEKLKNKIRKKKYEESFNFRFLLNHDLAETARKEADILKKKLLTKLERNALESNVFLRDVTEAIGSNIPIAVLKALFGDLTIHLRDNQKAVNSLDGSSLEIKIYKNKNLLISHVRKFYITIDGINGWRDAYNDGFLSTDGFVELVFNDIVEIISQ